MRLYLSGPPEDVARCRRALTALGAEVCADAPERCDGLVLAGGEDGAPLPGEEELIRSFVARRRPVLGICGGLQTLNAWFGGTLRRGVTGHRIALRECFHPTRVTPEAAWLLGAAPMVNSDHCRAVDAAGEGLVVCQRAPDGVPEALYHASLPVGGVQYRPEYMGAQGAAILRQLCAGAARSRR